MKKRVELYRGFTIVELLIVIVVIAILAAVTLVSYNGIQGRARESALQNELSQVSKSLASKKVLDSNEMYPASLSAINVTSDKLSYHYNTRSNTYCLDGKDGAIEYSVRGSSMKVEEGSCILHGMSLWLPLNGDLSDASGNEHTVTAMGSPSVTLGATGRTDGAYAFNGSDQYLSIQDPDSVPSRNDRFTISVWGKGTSPGNGTNYAYFVHKGSTTSIGNSFFNVGTNTGASQQIIASANGEYIKGNSGIGSDSSTWKHIVLVYAGGYQTVYVDGVQVVDISIGSITNAVTGTKFTIAGGAGGYRPLAGAVDDVRVYNRPLTAGEVTSLYQAGAQ